MKISTKGRYALRLMLDLAESGKDRYVSLREVAVRQEISDKYLEQIMIHLNRAGFVKSIRGAQGGYNLAKEPRDYTVGDILRVTEGDLAPVACLEEKAVPCSRTESCSTLFFWKELQKAIDQVMDSYTLQDLLDMQQKAKSSNSVD